MRRKQIIRISILGIIVNLILVTFKAMVGLLAGSIAIMLDAVNNFSDALAAIFTIVGTVFAHKRPDKKHPYGYGRVEYFSSVIVACLILFAGVTAIKESLEAIFNPHAPDYNIISLVIIAVGVLVKFFFGRYVKSAGKKLKSGSLVATGTDALSDALLALGTLVGALFNFCFQFNLEGYLGVIIGLFIIRSALEILRETLSDIIGERFDADFTHKIKQKILSYPEVKGVYDLLLHDYGPSNHIGAAHIEVDDAITAKAIHTLTRKITTDVFDNYGVIMTLGVYAANDSGRATKIKVALQKIIEKHPEILQLHGFYVNFETKQIAFDLILDFSAPHPTKIVQAVKDNLQQLYPQYNISITLDADISD